jgi:hypothetical protein
MGPRLLVAVALIAGTFAPAWGDPIDIGTRRESFVDDYVVDSLSGTAAFDLNKPRAQEVSLVTGEPWEGNTSGYLTVFQDGPMYRMSISW